MGNTIVQAMCWSILLSYFGKKIVEKIIATWVQTFHTKDIRGKYT